MLTPPQDAALNDPKTLQARLEAAFQPASADLETDRHETIGQCLASGRFGGVPLSQLFADAIVDLLKALGWHGEPEEIARAMPHFAPSFDAFSMLEVLARLGFKSRRIKKSLDSLLPGDFPVVDVTDPAAPRVYRSVDALQTRPDPVDGSTRRSGQHLVGFRAVEIAAGASTNQSWMYSTLALFRSEIGLMFLLTGLINVMVIVTSFTVISIYDSVIPTRSFDTLLAIAIGVLIAFSLEQGFRFLKCAVLARLSGRTEYLIGTTVFSKLMRMPYSMIAGLPASVQLARLSQFETVRNMLIGPFAAIGLELPFVLIFLAILFYIGGLLGLVAVVLVCVYLALGAVLFPMLKARTSQAAHFQRERQSLFLETISNLRSIRSIGGEKVWARKIADAVEKSADASRRAKALNQLIATISSAGVPLAGGMTVLTGALLVIGGSLTIGGLIGSMILIWRVLSPIQQTFMTMTVAAELVDTVKQIDRMLALPEVPEVEDLGLRRRFKGELSFAQVVHRYAGTPEPALKGVSFRIQAGEMVAIVGRSGSGMSTILRLMLNLYQPQAGSVTLDGTNLQQISRHDRNAAIGYVAHEPALFHGTIAQNLRMVAPLATDDDLRNVTAELGVLPAIERLEDGLHTRLNYKVQEKLPRGFRQALAIAQALLKKPRILLFDVPENALDPEIETYFLRALETRRGNTTIVIATHRPSYARLADRAMLLDNGRIAAMDDPDKILSLVNDQRRSCA